MFGQNLLTAKTFVQIWFDRVTKQVSELRDKNLELKRNLEFSQVENYDIQVKLRSNQSVVSENEGCDLRKRIRQLEYFNRRMKKHVTGIPGIMQKFLR